MDVRFVEYDKTFLTHSFQWLTDPEIKRLTMTPDIDEDSQLIWFEKLKSRTDYLIWGILADGVPVGAVGIKHIDTLKRVGEYWGYIGEKEFIGKGLGRQMVARMITEAAGLNLTQLVLQVAEYNERAYHLYLNCDFREIERNDGIIIMSRSVRTEMD